MFFLKYFIALVVLWIANSRAVNMNDFFPNIKQNLTKITWAHAVNNQSFLEETLKNNKINMIEADIQIGTFNHSEVPIMAHDPNTTSDLPLESFLRQIKEFNANATKSTKKGIKLDFKTTKAFEKSIDILLPYNLSDYPIWINADIIHGPINATSEPVDPTRFFAGATNFSNSVLSIGWTTSYGNLTGSYTSNQIQSMIKVIRNNNVTQNITFPVRAGLAAQSKDLMTNLTSEISNSSLTIWSSAGDNVNIDDLRHLIKAIGLNRTYIDVPEDVLEKLHLDNLPNSATLSKMTLPIYVIGLVACFNNIW